MSKTSQFKTGSFLVTTALLVFLFAGLSAFSMASGSDDIGFAKLWLFLTGGTLDETSRLIFWEIRLPRLCAGILAGASLSLAGAGMQSLFRNPLSDPSITGVSSGAALGAVIAITYFHSMLALQSGALAAGLVAVVVVCAIGRIDGKTSALSTLLGGIAVNAFCAAIVGFFMYSVRDAGLRGFVFWTLGSLDRCDWTSLSAAAMLCVPAWALMLSLAKPLNIMLLGREQAFHSGVNVDKVWAIAIFAAAVMTAAVVAICGVIGFVGLVVPHILRMLIGPDNRKLLPLSALAGASLLIFSDSVARSFSPTDPVPVGVITALIGAPFFAFMLRKGGFND